MPTSNKIIILENYKKQTYKGLTIIENVKEILPKYISKESINDMIYNYTIIEENLNLLKELI